MHDTAAAFGAAFFRSYIDTFDEPRILEIGANDVNGSLRGCAPTGARYTGIDLDSGPGVDLVLPDPYAYPFDDESFDAVVSSSCFEHDPMFWLSFVEMCRVVAKGGFIYLSAPSNGPFHRYPTDNWRFYPDAGKALTEWGRRTGHDIRLIESLIARRRRDVWNDCVMVFGKAETSSPVRFLAELFPRSFNIRIGEGGCLQNHREHTEDMTIQAWLTEKLEVVPVAGSATGDASIGGIVATLAEREVSLAVAERNAAAVQVRLSDESRARAEIERERSELADRLSRQQRLSIEKEQRLIGLKEELATREQALATLREELATVLREREAILSSTCWRLTAPVRNLLAALPPGLRRQARRVGRVMYWILTPHRTRERIAYLRTRRGGQRPKAEGGLPASDRQSTRP